MSSFVFVPTNNDPTLDSSQTASSDTSSDLTTLCYPLDLLSDKTSLPSSSQDKVVPFMGFYIFVPVTSKAAQGEGDPTLDDSATQDLALRKGLDYASEVNKKLDIQTGEEVVKSMVNSDQRIRIFRQVKALKTFIALYMPETLNSDLNASYSSTNYGGGLLSFGGALASAIKHGVEGDFLPKAEDTITAIMATLPALGPATSVFKEVGRFAQAGRGNAINPLSEVFFENMLMRQFNFDFKFVPKSQDEMKEIQSIIKLFRMYMVPEINKDFVAGTFLSVPAFFQIKYYLQQDGQLNENDNIPKISGCILTGVQVDMAPDGIALHTDGAPVAIRVQLNFQELEIMHRDRILQGY